MRLAVISFGGLTTVRAKELWICWGGATYLRVRKTVRQRVTVVKFGVENLSV